MSSVRGSAGGAGSTVAASVVQSVVLPLHSQRARTLTLAESCVTRARTLLHAVWEMYFGSQVMRRN